MFTQLTRVIMLICASSIIAAPFIVQAQQTFLFPCVDSFDTFSYHAPQRFEREMNADYRPPFYWTYVADLPFEELSGWSSSVSPSRSFAQVLTTRTIDFEQEIWGVMGFYSDRQLFSQLFIYRPALNEWEYLPQLTGDPQLFLSELFVTPDQSVWALWNVVETVSVPVLARFSEAARQFESVEAVPYLNAEQSDSPYGFDMRPQVVMDNTGMFWIVNVDTNLYRYDPMLDTTEIILDLSDFELGGGVSTITVSADGSLYLGLSDRVPGLSGDVLFEYLPQTDELVSISLPQEWPTFSDVFVDSSGRLWLDTVGYREETGTWHLLHTGVEEYFAANGTEFQYAAAPIIAETSDGYLWVRKNNEFVRGIAWFNPVTGDGCQLMTQALEIAEDREGFVWIADAQLGALFHYHTLP